MKSNVCYLSGKNGRRTVLEEVEKAASYAGLENKKLLQVRLLTEELLGMAEGIVGHYQAIFWLEEENQNFELHLQLEKKLDGETQERIIQTATSGKNEAERSLMGKIRGFMEYCITNYEEVSQFCASNGIRMTNTDAMAGGCAMHDKDAVWSLHEYEKNLRNDSRHQPEWDELERSIIAKYADDVVVYVRRKQTEIVVKKSFRSQT